jgi:hypothetical protein
MNTAQIEFKPDLIRGRGGRITLNEPMTAEAVVKAYLDWLVMEHPELKGEVSYDSETNCLFIGYWDIDLTFDPSLITFEVDGLEVVEQVVDEGSTELDASAPATAVPASPTPLNSVDISAILQPKAQLDVVRIHDKATMVESRQFAQAATIPSQGGMQSFSPAGTVSEMKANNGLTEIATQPAINREAVQTPRVFIKNQPEQQRQPRSSPSSSHYESTTMGNQKRNTDTRNAPARSDNKGRPQGRRDDYLTSSDARYTNSRPQRPADPEMIERLLANGIGGIVAPVDTNAFTRDFRNRQLQAKRVRDEDFIDGETCINVSAAAETPLGHALRLSEVRTFDYPNIGRFASLTGLFLMMTEHPCKSYNSIAGAQANRALHMTNEVRRELAAVQNLSKDEFDNGVRGYYDLRSIYAVMADALWLTVNQDPKLVVSLLENELAFECYTWVRVKQNDAEREAKAEPRYRLRHEPYGMWYLPLLREVVRCLRARLRAVEDGKSGEQLPKPNFNQAIDNGIQRLRRRLAREMERRELGYARPRVEKAVQAPQPFKAEAPAQINEAIFGKPRGERGAPQVTASTHDVEPIDPDQFDLDGEDSAGDTTFALSGENTPGLTMGGEATVVERGTAEIEGQPASENGWNGTVSDTVVSPDADFSNATIQPIIGVSTEPMGEVAVSSDQLEQAKQEVAAQPVAMEIEVTVRPQVTSTPVELSTAAPQAVGTAPVMKEFTTASS